MAAASGSGSDATDEGGRVSKIASKMRVFEDFGMAYRMQEEEFGTHYDHNRHERRLVGSDTKKTKEEQELEDKYAAEYRAQVQRDLAEKDAQLALQMQLELEREEKRKLEEIARIDQEIARRIQTQESNDGYRQPRYDPTDDELLARQLQETLNSPSPSARRGPDPFGFRPAVVALPPPVVLPSGETPQLRQVLNEALREEDMHFAKYVQDRELAKFEQQKERARLRLTEEQRQNELNMAAMGGRPIAAVGGRRRSSTGSSGGTSSNAPPPRPPPPKMSGLRRVDDPPVANLISFDSDDLPPPPTPPPTLLPTNPFLQDLQNQSFPPPPSLQHLRNGAVGNAMTSETQTLGGPVARPTYKPPAGAIRVLPHQ
uniref:Coiled-coil domain-containing protein n=1 Tax=Plectus sambesii TaxID=2011161 RepID=A0A914X708_9BILA